MPTPDDLVLDVRDLKKYFPIRARRVAADRGLGTGGGRRQLPGAARRDRGPGGRERLRQDHPAAQPGARRRSHRAARSTSTARGERTDVAQAEGDELKRARQAIRMVFQDPGVLAQPAHDGAPHRRGAAGDQPRGILQGGGRAPHAGAAGPRRAQAGASQPLPLRLLRRPAAAHRRRPRPGPGAGAAARRRAHLGARRLGAGADPQPADGAAARDAPGDHLRDPRPERGAPHGVAGSR